MAAAELWDTAPHDRPPLRRPELDRRRPLDAPVPHGCARGSRGAARKAKRVDDLEGSAGLTPLAPPFVGPAASNERGCRRGVLRAVAHGWSGRISLAPRAARGGDRCAA